MCEFCEKEKHLIDSTNFNTSPLWMGMGATFTAHDVEMLCEREEAVFIDKRCDTAFLRLVDPTDCNCIEAGKKIEIKFCPMCGEKLKNA